MGELTRRPTPSRPNDALVEPDAWTSRSARGAASELTACAHLMRQGYHVYRCESPAAPFDLVAYRDGEMLRVEVKTASMPADRWPGAGPGVPWPKNDEWDLLVVVCPDGQCVEITDHDQHAGTDLVRAHCGYEPARRPARMGTVLDLTSDQVQVHLLALLRDHPEITWTVAAASAALLERGWKPRRRAATAEVGSGLIQLYNRGLADKACRGQYRLAEGATK